MLVQDYVDENKQLIEANPKHPQSLFLEFSVLLTSTNTNKCNFKEFKDGLLHCGATPMHIYGRLMHSKELANGLIQRALALLRQAQALNRKAKALHLRK
ncbi:hypothetical protein Tco_1527254 [Tanacetum coccineum]